MPSTGIDRIDGNTTSVAVKAPCTVAASGPITLSGIQTIDGVLLQAGNGGTTVPDRVLVMGQADQTTNGIYLVQTGNWIQAYDFDGPRDAVTGTLIFVRSGNTYAHSWWRVATTDNPIEFGISDITFSQVNDMGNISAAMVPVVTANTLALARTALGLGAAAVEALGGPIIDDGSSNHNLTINSGGVLSSMMVKGSSTQAGAVSVDGAIITISAGQITAAKASSAQYGVAEIDGITIQASSVGVLKSLYTPLSVGAFTWARSSANFSFIAGNTNNAANLYQQYFTATSGGNLVQNDSSNIASSFVLSGSWMAFMSGGTASSVTYPIGLFQRVV